MSQITSPRPVTFLGRVARLFRFHLATLLVVTAVIAGWLAWTFNREQISAANVSRLSKSSEIPCEGIFKLVYSPDRSRVAFVAWEAPVEVREAITHWQVRTIGADRKLIDFAFSPDQQRVAYCENSSQAEILALKTGQRLVLETDDQQPDVVFSPDGQRLATGGYATGVKLWDAETGKLVRYLACRPDRSGLRPAFSPDGRTIAVGDRNSNTILFDVASGKRLLVLPERETQELAFHPLGKTLAVAYANGSIRLWEQTTGVLIAEHENVADEIYTLDWSLDGELLASAGLKGEICISDKNLQLLHSLPAPEWVISVKFSPDGTRLVTAGGSQADRSQRGVTIWGVPPLVSRMWGR